MVTKNEIRVMLVFGTRPEAVKMAPVVKAIENEPGMKAIVCVTAQHRQMLDQVLAVFDIVPDYDLDIMKDRQSLSGITSRALTGLEMIIKEEAPDILLVHGDTTTTFSAALAAFYQQVPIGHVEAGLRTFNKYEPFPEEMNRKLTGALADWHFAPTERSKQNLKREAIADERIYVTGNTVIDALQTTLKDDYRFELPELNQIDLTKPTIVMTAHRRENLGQPLVNICRAVKQVTEKYLNVQVIYAVHLNPVVRETAEKYLAGVERVHLVPPLDLQDMHNLMNRSYLVLTDSGGLQEEVPSMGKPVLVLRNVTERPEGIEAGTLKLVGTETEVIVEQVSRLLEDESAYSAMSTATNPYGDGKASQRIARLIKQHYGLK